MTYSVLVPWLPSGGPYNIPLLGKAQVPVGVTPVVQFFTINNVPQPPNPIVNPVNFGKVAFGNDPRNGGIGNSIHYGFQTFGLPMNLDGNIPPNPPTAPPKAAAIFDAQAFKKNLDGTLHFIDNMTITNGGDGATNAWTFAGGLQAQNWVWIKNGRQVASINPILDQAANPPPPYYPSNSVPISGSGAGDLVQIQGEDRPRGPYPGLTARGLRAGTPLNMAIVTKVAWTYNFTIYLAWSMPAGEGAPAQPALQGKEGLGTVIYLLAERPWSVVFDANASIANGWADSIVRGSGVFTPGDFVLAADWSSLFFPVFDPVLTGPIANNSIWIS